MILDALMGSVTCTTSSRSYVFTASRSFGVLVVDLRSLSSGFLQRDFRHFQLLNVRKLLDSIQPDVQDVHSWLQSVSCSC